VALGAFKKFVVELDAGRVCGECCMGLLMAGDMEVILEEFDCGVEVCWEEEDLWLAGLRGGELECG